MVHRTTTCDHGFSTLEFAAAAVVLILFVTSLVDIINIARATFLSQAVVNSLADQLAAIDMVDDSLSWGVNINGAAVTKAKNDLKGVFPSVHFATSCNSDQSNCASINSSISGTTISANLSFNVPLVIIGDMWSVNTYASRFIETASKPTQMAKIGQVHTDPADDP